MCRSRRTGWRSAAGACPARVPAWAVVFAVASWCAGRGAAQTPAGTPPPDPPRATAFALTGADTSAPQGPVAPDGGPGPDGGRGLLFLPPPSEPRRSPLEASWNDGLQFESANKQFHLHVGGIGQIDSVWLIGPKGVFAVPGGGMNGVENASATELRRAILQADGTIFGRFDYEVQIDFANASNDNSGLQPPSFGNLTSSPAPLNIWMQVRDVPYLGNVRVGSQVKPTCRSPFFHLRASRGSSLLDKGTQGPFVDQGPGRM